MICACGCGTIIPSFDSRGRPRSYCKGHQSRILAKPTPWQKRFSAIWETIEKPDVGCWNWTEKLDRSGYGRMAVRYPNWHEELCHRLSWVFHRGLIPTGVMVCHSCDNPSCVRPDHLFLGTAADNMHDMFNKGRRRPRSGETHPKAKLANADVQSIRALLRDGYGLRVIGKRFGVTHKTIMSIRDGHTWKELADNGTVGPVY